MWPFRRRPHVHRWGPWTYCHIHGATGSQQICDRSCRCGAIQRYNRQTGEVTIWSPDGMNSGLLDRGLTRQVFEDL